MGTLFIVATPIGNLEDITFRAVRVLKEADRIVAEDTRRTRGLLTHFGIASKPVASLEAHATERDVEREAEHLASGHSTALVTDAGVPGVSDPGAALIEAAVVRGIPVVPIPGPSAVTTAVAASGLVSASFVFLGFLPRSGPERDDRMTRVGRTADPVVLFESPERIAATIRDLAALMPDRRAVVAREMTKMHEEFARGTLSELARGERDWIGEITLVLGPDKAAGAAPSLTDSEIDARIDLELALGLGVKVTAQRVAAWSGRPRREIYERATFRSGKRDPRRQD